MPDIPKVSDLMVNYFKTIDGITMVSRALTMMKELGINVVRISPRGEDNIYGIMTPKNIPRKGIAQR